LDSSIFFADLRPGNQLNLDHVNQGIQCVQVAYYAVIRRPGHDDREMLFGDRYLPTHAPDHPSFIKTHFKYLEREKESGAWDIRDVSGLLCLFDPEREDEVLFLTTKEATLLEAEIAHL
jgi:hypothetical protein